MKIRIKQSKMISAKEVNEMFQIYKGSYNSTRNDFENKRTSIDAYALYYNKGMELVGFTGIRNQEINVEQKKYYTLYIGQTIILSEYRGKSLIQRTIMKLFLKFMLKNPFKTIIVWNDSLSYRPYLLIARKLKKNILTLMFLQMFG